MTALATLSLRPVRHLACGFVPGVSALPVRAYGRPTLVPVTALLAITTPSTTVGKADAEPNCHREGQSIVVPELVSPTMIDGVLSPGEWDRAVVAKTASGTMRMKQTAEFLYVAITFPKGRSGFTDLFISTDCKRAVDLHASAKLGERRANGDWSWWTNTDWIANVSRVDSFERRTFLPTNTREYQISLKKFAGSRWSVRAELSATNNEGRPYALASMPQRTTWLISVRSD